MSGPRFPSLVVALALAGLPAPGVAEGLLVPWDARDVRGRALSDPSPPRAVVDGEAAGTLAPVVSPDARVVLWFDRTLAGGATIRRAAQSLGGLAAELTGVGEVEVVLADPTADRLLRTRDPLTLEQRMSWLGLREGGASRLLAERTALLGRLPRLTPDDRVDAVVRAVVDEQRAVVAALDELLAQAGDELAGLRFLFWIADGFDLDPVQFWAARLEAEEARRVARETVALPGASEVEARWRALAALGWVVWSVRPAGEAGGLDFDVLQPGDPSGADVAPAATVLTLRPGRKSREEEADAAPEAELVDAAPSLRGIARETGGRVLESGSGLREAVLELAGWRLGRLEPSPNRDLGAADPLPLELDVDGAASVRGPRWIGGSPAVLALARARRLLDGGFEGTLGFTALAERGGADGADRLQLRLDVDAEDGGEASPLLVTVTDGAEAVLRREVLPPDGEEAALVLELPDDTGALVVQAERTDGSGWGVVRPAVVTADAPVPLDRGPVVRLRRPEEKVLAGKTRFGAEVWDPRVSRIEFVLDDELAGEADGPPWEARLDLGRPPTKRRLAVVAYDAAGDEIGRDAVLLNAGSGELGVRIVRPTEPEGTGWVEVEARVDLPVERRLDRLVVYWNAEPVATLHAPPYVARVRIPEDRPLGYVRALALLDDGTVAEDVLFMNGPRSGERVDVHLVELYTVVTDRNGRPVRGLGREDFRLLEGGREQEIADFREAEDLPLTIGMAVDSSASMFVKLPRMQQAAARFLRSTFEEPRDRAFVVDFDSEPRLARGITGDLDRVLRAIDGLSADGRTALWESVVFSLVQLQGIAGRKALVVFSDGADEDDAFPFSSCLQVARRMGVPVYLIFMREEPEEGALSLFTRSLSDRVNRLVEATGGRVFWTRSLDELDAVYAEIESELRSQYLLTYYPDREGQRAGSWRDVEIEVEGDGLTPRTLSGYWP